VVQNIGLYQFKEYGPRSKLAEVCEKTKKEKKLDTLLKKIGETEIIETNHRHESDKPKHADAH